MVVRRMHARKRWCTCARWIVCLSYQHGVRAREEIISWVRGGCNCTREMKCEGARGAVSLPSQHQIPYSTTRALPLPSNVHFTSFSFSQCTFDSVRTREERFGYARGATCVCTKHSVGARQTQCACARDMVYVQLVSHWRASQVQFVCARRTIYMHRKSG